MQRNQAVALTAILLAWCVAGWAGIHPPGRAPVHCDRSWVEIAVPGDGSRLVPADSLPGRLDGILQPAVASRSSRPVRLVAGLKGDWTGPFEPTAAACLCLGYKIDINKASPRDLTALPGVGPAIAARICRERESGGPFREPAALERVHGVGPALFAQIEGLVLAGKPEGDKIVP